MNAYSIVSSVVMLLLFGVWVKTSALNVVIKIGLLCMGVWGLSTWL